MSNIAVMGAGAWGTALALNLAKRGGHRLVLWTYSADEAEAIRQHRENMAFLPGFPLPEEIAVTADPGAALADAEIVVGVMPSEHARATYTRLAGFLQPGQLLVSATKGIEEESYLRMTSVVGEVLGAHGLHLPCGVLSGPSFAQEVASGFPTAITVAFAESGLASRVQRELSSGSLRLYTNDDVTGVELGGALKNVIAIAAGVVEGLGLGYNSAAALITRGIAEITRLAVACGGRRETLAGLSGIGDLVLTCTGSLSRNRTVGVELGKGRQLADILAGLHGKVAEGVATTSAAIGLARKMGVEMPIAEQMDAILHHGKPPVTAMRELMARPGRDE
jgi:glycerol-3-phosphate dehydrogenase (NAD(P)+)